MDCIPIFSQAKSFVQWVAGDDEGARQTQNNFTKGCPIVSQVRSAVEALHGDCHSARETQKYFIKNVENITDSIPVVGHVKGTVHYALGQSRKGDECMRSASRSIGVIGGGVAGFAVAGPGGAFAGGAAGGIVMDATITGIESAINEEYVPYGTVNEVSKIVKGEATPGDVFDAVANPILDGYCGSVAARGPARIPGLKNVVNPKIMLRRTKKVETQGHRQRQGQAQAQGQQPVAVAGIRGRQQQQGQGPRNAFVGQGCVAGVRDLEDGREAGDFEMVCRPRHQDHLNH